MIADPRPDPEQVCSSSEIAPSVNEQFNLLPSALRSVFAPYGPHPSRFWRLAPWPFLWLGCRDVN